MVSHKFVVVLLIVALCACTEGWWLGPTCRPRPCSLGPWAAWSACSAKECGQPGYKTRTLISQIPAACGGPCRNRKQTVFCVKQCASTMNDPRCRAMKGRCAINTNYCSGGYASGLCRGPSNRECCIPWSQCTVRRYRNSYFVGDMIFIEDGFRSSLDTVGRHAKTCKVKVYVTHSWRKLGAKIGGAIVTPASNSTHLVGHAIDFNLKHGSTHCNSACMQSNYRKSETNPYKCFLTKVMGSGLRWGGVWTKKDPVHIDDNYYHRNSATYRNLRKTLQAACKHIPMS